VSSQTICALKKAWMDELYGMVSETLVVRGNNNGVDPS